jgi:hypothetical protein
LLNDNHRIEENGAFGLQDVGLALAGLTRLPSRKLIVVQFESLAARDARKYGISDVALSNVCRQLQIPKAAKRILGEEAGRSASSTSSKAGPPAPSNHRASPVVTTSASRSSSSRLPVLGSAHARIAHDLSFVRKPTATEFPPIAREASHSSRT